MIIVQIESLSAIESIHGGHASFSQLTAITLEAAETKDRDIAVNPVLSCFACCEDLRHSDCLCHLTHNIILKSVVPRHTSYLCVN